MRQQRSRGRLRLISLCVTLILGGLASRPAKAAALPGPGSGMQADAAARAAALPGPAPGWHVDNEWFLEGNYAEACTDPPLCPGLFGAPPCGGPCRKLMIFQVLRGRYHNTNLTGVTAVAAIESPADAAIGPASRNAWPRCELLISDRADSSEAVGIRMTLGAMLLGAGGPAFTRVETVPLHVTFSGARVTAESAGRLEVRLRPGLSLNKVTAPDLNNLGSSFPFLGSLYVYETDTLYYAVDGALAQDAGADAAVGPGASKAGPAARAAAARAKAAAEAKSTSASVNGRVPDAVTGAWNFAGRSGVVSQFTWNSQVAYGEAGVAARKP